MSSKYLFSMTNWYLIKKQRSRRTRILDRWAYAKNLECVATSGFKCLFRRRNTYKIPHRWWIHHGNFWSDTIKQLNLWQSDLNTCDNIDPLTFGNLITYYHWITKIAPSVGKSRRKKCASGFWCPRRELLSKTPSFDCLIRLNTQFRQSTWRYHIIEGNKARLTLTGKEHRTRPLRNIIPLRQ